MMFRGSVSRVGACARNAKPVLLTRAPLPRVSLTRAHATGRSKSWSEILTEAADLAKDVAGKVVDTVSQGVQAIVPKKEEEPPKPAPQRRRSPREPTALDRPGLFSGLLGRAVGGLVASAVEQIGNQLERAAQESRSVYDDAAARIMASQRLRSAMGEVRVGPVISQSVSSTYVNGVSAKMVNLVFPVYGMAGEVAQAQVVAQESSKATKSDITVQLPNGSLVKIEAGGGGGRGTSAAGQTIDVEYTEVKR